MQNSSFVNPSRTLFDSGHHRSRTTFQIAANFPFLEIQLKNILRQNGLEDWRF